MVEEAARDVIEQVMKVQGKWMSLHFGGLINNNVIIQLWSNNLIQH
jgi:hypothetical protein